MSPQQHATSNHDVLAHVQGVVAVSTAFADVRIEQETCFECGQPILPHEESCPMPRLPQRHAHLHCRVLVMSVALSAVGL